MFRVIFDSLTHTIPDGVVLNHETSRDFEATINFGKAKINLFINTYNWCITYPREIIHLALADITACFCFPQISAELMGAFECIVEKLNFISTSHVFGSNTFASSWEALRQAIQNVNSLFSEKRYGAKKHRKLLGTLKWQEDAPVKHGLAQVFACEMNPCVMKEEPCICTLLTANIYVDNILAAAAHKKIMEKLLAAITKAIFVVCGQPDIAIHQCPLFLEKWNRLIVGPKQIILGLIVNTNKMTVGITDKYIQQIQDLLNLWDPNCRLFKVNDMQKLIACTLRRGKQCPAVTM
jgi:hypothetical protein